MATHTTPPEETEKIELILSILLRAGVLTSLAAIVIGTLVTFVHHPTYSQSAGDLANLVGHNADFPHSLRETWDGIRAFHGQSIVILGLLLLILTPVLRVAVSILAFAYENDWPFVWITTFVLIALLVSFLLGKAG